MRTCVGCHKTDEAERMVRLVLGDDGNVLPDLRGRALGRGAWVHPGPDCLGRAPRGLSRSFGCRVTTDARAIWGLLRAAADRRVASLLSSAKAAGALRAGSDAAREALESDEARLVLVATDARAAATTPWTSRAVSDGKAVAWGTKALVGHSVGRGETGVVAVTDDGLARAVQRTVALANTPAPVGQSAAGGADASAEVR